MKLTSYEALLATVVIGIMMLALRLLPFIIFSKRKTPSFFSFIEKFIPAISIAVLFTVYLKEHTADLLIKNSSPLQELPSVICAVVSCVFTAAIHFWKGNAMISIFGGTILYMILNYLF